MVILRKSSTQSTSTRSFCAGRIIGLKGIPNPIARILTFTTDPLKEDTEVTGPIVLILYASSDQKDTDFYVKLSDQGPMNFIQRLIMKAIAGEVIPPAKTVTKGWLTASHRAVDPVKSKPYRPWHTHMEPTPLIRGMAYVLCFQEGARDQAGVSDRGFTNL